MKILLRVVIAVVAVFLYFTVAGLLTAHRDDAFDGVFILIGFVVYIYAVGKIVLWLESHKRTPNP